MPTSFPGAIDTFADPTANDTLDGNVGGPSVYHDVQHADLNDAMTAVQTAIGPTGGFNFITGAALPLYSVGDQKYWEGQVGIGNVVNDTAALTNSSAALIVAGEGVNFVPAGNFHFSEFPSFVPDGETLPFAFKGAGKGVTTIFSHAASLAASLEVSNPTFNPNAATEKCPEWGGFVLDGTNSSGGAVGLHWGDCSYPTFRDFAIQNFTASDGMYWHNQLGWTEGVRLSSAQITNCLNAHHFLVDTGGYPSFDYWVFHDLWLFLNQQQNGFVDEASLGSLTAPGQTQHQGSKFKGVSVNAASSASANGKLFWTKGHSVWSKTGWDLSGEVDGALGHSHISFQQDATTSIFGGSGSIDLPGFASPVYTGGGGSFQLQPLLTINIPGLSTSTAATTTGTINRNIFAEPSGAGVPTFVTAVQWQNLLGADVFLIVPITFTGAATVNLKVQLFSISGSGPQVAAGASGTQVPLAFLVKAGSFARIDVANATIGATAAFYA